MPYMRGRFQPNTTQTQHTIPSNSSQDCSHIPLVFIQALQQFLDSLCRHHLFHEEVKKILKRLQNQSHKSKESTYFRHFDNLQSLFNSRPNLVMNPQTESLSAQHKGEDSLTDSLFTFSFHEKESFMPCFYAKSPCALSQSHIFGFFGIGDYLIIELANEEFALIQPQNERDISGEIAVIALQYAISALLGYNQSHDIPHIIVIVREKYYQTQHTNQHIIDFLAHSPYKNFKLIHHCVVYPSGSLHKLDFLFECIDKIRRQDSYQTPINDTEESNFAFHYNHGHLKSENPLQSDSMTQSLTGREMIKIADLLGHFGALWCALVLLETRGASLEGKFCVITGDNVNAIMIAKGLNLLHAKPLTLSNHEGFIYNERGLDIELLSAVYAEMKTENTLFKESRNWLKVYATRHKCEFISNKHIRDIPAFAVFFADSREVVAQETIQAILRNGCKCVSEALPSLSMEAQKLLLDSRICYAPFMLTNSAYFHSKYLYETYDKKMYNTFYHAMKEILHIDEAYFRTLIERIEQATLRHNNYPFDTSPMNTITPSIFTTPQGICYFLLERLANRIHRANCLSE